MARYLEPKLTGLKSTRTQRSRLLRAQLGTGDAPDDLHSPAPGRLACCQQSAILLETIGSIPVMSTEKNLGVSNDTVISASSLELVFQTNDGPVHALSDVDLAVCGKGDFVSPSLAPRAAGRRRFCGSIADLEQPTGGCDHGQRANARSRLG